MVDKRFPTIEYETIEDEHGINHPRQDGERCQRHRTPDAERRGAEGQESALKDLEKLKGEFPDSALDQIINKYGSGKVAEMTSARRRVRNPETGQRELQWRGSYLAKTNLHEMAAFQNGNKTIAIISNAAAVGIN